MPASPNPQALADWGIQTGRLPLDGRRRFLEEFSADPVAASARLLSQPATREPERACPLFSGVYARFSTSARKGHLTRRLGQSALVEVAEQVAAAAVEAVGGDPSDPEIQRAVRAALADLAKKQQRVQARRREIALQRPDVLAAWDDEPTIAAQSQRFWGELEHATRPPQMKERER